MVTGALDQDKHTVISDALHQMSQYIDRTPLVKFSQFDDVFNQDIFFKLESMQKIGSFKTRGVLNYLLNYLKKHQVKDNVLVTYGTGNHAASLAWFCQEFGINLKIFLSKNATSIKKSLIQQYGADLECVTNRAEAERLSCELAKKPGYILVPTADDHDIIVGAATVLYEIFHEIGDFDGLFVPVGGGSFASGSIMTKELYDLKVKIYAGEPKEANDVAISYRTGKVFRFV